MSSPQKILNSVGVSPSKKWGQNFLAQPASAKKIVAWAEIGPNDLVLEIGPGLGAMTHVLVDTAKKVIAVERDRKLFTFLSEQLAHKTNVQLIQDDIREVDLLDLSKKEKTKLTVVSNLPYSLSTPILEHLLGAESGISTATLLLQEEVVDRICGSVGTSSYGRLSLWVQSRWEVRRGPRISRTSFHPSPDVESRLVKVRPMKNPRVSKAALPSFLRLAAILFQQRRKTLRRGLRKLWDDPVRIERTLKRLGLSPQQRPETLRIEDLLALATTFGPPDNPQNI